MKLDLTWTVTVIAAAAVVIAAILTPNEKNSKQLAEEKCVENNGVPIHNSWGSMVDCKIYK